MHPNIENYLVMQSLIKGKASIVKNKQNKEFVASNMDSMMLYRKVVIISNEWFLLHVHHGYLRKIIRLLKKSGVKQEDISYFHDIYSIKLYVTQDPKVFIPQLIEFEKLLNKSKDS